MKLFQMRQTANLTITETWNRYMDFRKMQYIYLDTRFNLSDPRTIRYKFGVKVPRTYAEAVKFDEENGNTLWMDAIRLEWWRSPSKND